MITALQSRLSPRNWQLRIQLLVFMLGLTLAPLLIVGAVNILGTRSALIENIRNDYRQQSSIRAGHIADLLEQQIQLLGVVSTSNRFVLAAQTSHDAYPSRLDAARAQIERLDQAWVKASDRDFLIRQRTQGPLADELRRLKDLIPGQAEIFLTDSYGAMIAATERTSDLDQYDEAWWQAAWNNGTGSLYIGPPERDQSAGVQALALALPVRNPIDGRPVGVLRSTYSLAAIDALVAGYAGAEQPHMLVIGPDNIVLASTNPSEVNQPLAESLRQWQTFSESNAENESGLILAASPVRSSANLPMIEDLGWHVLLAQDGATASAPVTSQIVRNLLTAFVLALLSGAAALALGTHLTLPLNRLARAAQRGDLAMLAAAPTNRNDEVGQLANSLQALAQRVLESRSQIEATNRSLEATVAQRTAELQTVVDSQKDLLATQARLLSQIAQMSMPVLPVHNGVLVMPLIGTLDDERAANLTGNLLKEIERQSAHVALIDITGVPVVDTHVARALLDAVAGARLLGARVILVGLRPEIAQTLVSLGIELGGLDTTASLQDGLRLALQRMQKPAR